MTAVKTAKTYTLEELKERAGLALNVPALVEIAKTAPLSEDGKINITWARDKTYMHVVEQTGDLKDAKKLADSTRVLAMLRRDFPEEFEKIVLEKELKKEVKTEVPKKLFHEIEFNFPSLGNISSVELITRESGSGHGITVERSMRFHSDAYNNRTGPRELGARFCMEIINSLIETADSPGDMSLMNDLTQLLEKKFGLKVKVCLNCNHGDFSCQNGVGTLICLHYKNSSVGELKIGCELWTPKEIPAEKKEN